MAIDRCSIQTREFNKFVESQSRPGEPSVEVTIGNTDPIPVDFTPGDVVNTFNSVGAVAASTLTTVVSYTVPVDKVFNLQFIEFGGENIATFEVLIDGVLEGRQRTYFGGPLSGVFLFEGLRVASGLIITLRVEHSRPMSGEFEGRILGALLNGI